MNHMNLSIEQRIIHELARRGLITNVGDVTRALKDIIYAEQILALEGNPGITDDVRNDAESGAMDICVHRALTNEEIQEVFDNDK